VYKALFLAAFIQFFFFNSTIFSQKNRIEGLFFSLKAGFHSSDNRSNFQYDNFSAGFSIDGTAEIHTGKNWYLGLNYDVSYGNTNYYSQEMDITAYSFTALVKYRLFIDDKAAVYLGLGIGGTTMLVGNYNKDRMLTSNIRLGVDFPLEYNFVISGEAVYQSMGEFDLGGGGRHNNIAMFKFGFGYVFSLKQ
jgi:hypothetical protein